MPIPSGLLQAILLQRKTEPASYIRLPLLALMILRSGRKNNLGILILVDKQGKFIDGVDEFSGRYVKNYKDDPQYVDVNVDICVKLKKENRAFKIEKYEHTYPHCWRTDKPILYYPLDAWFIKTTAVKGQNGGTQ